MAGLAATTRDLAELKKRWKDRLSGGKLFDQMRDGSFSASGRLSRVAAFGSNPGALDMFTYVPEHLPPAPAMVVVLHGCTQDAAGYDLGSGWSSLADEYGFVLVYPQQTRANNPNSCFNWFLPGDTTRGQGEALSIRQMVERAASDHSVDQSRIFVTGLSAGGAMAAVMLATYPDVFAAGGIVAGLPYGAAANVQEALHAMFESPERSPRQWGDLVRSASSFQGPWPRLSVWHGGADHVVKPGNAGELVKQWTDIHDLRERPSGSGMVDGHLREVWRDPDGREVIESFTIAGMGHGTPLQVGDQDGMGGAAGAYMLDVGISSSHHMAAFWGLTAESAGMAARPSSVVPPINEALPPRGRPVQDKVFDGVILPPGGGPEAGRADSVTSYVESVISDAFRAAGLKK
jgi:feruloyl esterase